MTFCFVVDGAEVVVVSSTSDNGFKLLLLWCGGKTSFFWMLLEPCTTSLGAIMVTGSAVSLMRV